MKFVERKSMIIRESGRSSDYITPTFGHGCLYRCSYCYMRRHIKQGITTIATNTEALINAIDEHAMSLQWPKEPNQTHAKYYTYDFSCNEDYVLHAKYHEWEKLFDYFVNSDRVMGTAATKFVNKHLLNYNPQRKVRIRFSLMPQKMASILEPGTSRIVDRIEAINTFYEAGYDVHINFSPIIAYEGCGEEYKELFELINSIVNDDIKKDVLSECIFLVHNKGLHEYNVKNNIKGEEYLWTPHKQEGKQSIFGGDNVRYAWKYKQGLIDGFVNIHDAIIPWNKIRYIF